MNYFYKNTEKFHYIALLLAFFLHAILSFWFFLNKSKPVILQQTIRVEMVSPSSQKQVKIEKKVNKKENVITSNNNKVETIKTETIKKEPTKSEDKNSKNSSEINSSGKIDKNATAKNSASSEPIFNASYLHNPTPSYPSYAKSKGFEGKVILEVLVSKSGNAEKVIISKSSGYTSLDNAAKESVEKWHFIPAYAGANAIAAKVLVPVEFKLN